MEKNIIYLYVLNTLSDWETGFAIAELNSRRYFKKDAPLYTVKTVAVSKDVITTMGGVKIIPDTTVAEIETDKVAMLILPGSEDWNDPRHNAVLDLAERLLEDGTPVAGICGATAAMANRGLLDSIRHTSDDLGFLQQVSPNYKGSSNYVNLPAVSDGNVITASAVGSLEFAQEIFKKLEVFEDKTLNAWYNLFDTKQPQYFYELMESLEAVSNEQ